MRSNEPLVAPGIPGGSQAVVRRGVAILLALVIGGFVLKALAGAAEAKLVFFPTRGQDDTPATLGIRYDALRLRTSDGEQLAAWQLEPDEPVADVVYFHGNGGNLSVWMPVLATLHQHRLRVLAVDYRGYGLSSGTPSEQGLYRDAEAAVMHAVAQRTAPRRPLVYWGRSLGGPVAASGARIAPPDGLILESTFPDKASVVRSNPVLRALNVFATYRFPTAEMLQQFRNPVLVVHATNDSIVPHALGRELYDQLRGPRQFLDIAQANHNDLFVTSRQSYWKPILDFVATLRGRE